MCKINLAAHGRRILPYYRWAIESRLLFDRADSRPVVENSQAMMRAGRSGLNFSLDTGAEI